VAELIIELIGSSSNVVYKPLPADDPMQRQPQIDFARAQLDWRPSVVLEQGLRETIAYFERLLMEESHVSGAR
jgi:UDP-glucuronate decarboxylase